MLEQDSQPAERTASEQVSILANQLPEILLRLTRLLRSETQDLGITSTQSGLLTAIARTPNIGLGELAEQERITAPTLVNHIDKLVAAGFVERVRSHPTDRRRISISITEEGVRVLAEFRERRTAWLTSHLAHLSLGELSAIAAAIDPLHSLVE